MAATWLISSSDNSIRPICVQEIDPPRLDKDEVSALELSWQPGKSKHRGDFNSLLSLPRRPQVSEIDMFIAMNRFRVAKGSEAAFEQVWLSRDSHLDKVPGFVEFHLLKGPEAEDHTLYASHTVWESRAVFEAWTKSEAFRAAHSRAGDNKPLYLDHPQFEAFEVRQTVGRGKTVAE
jgi:heme-degrading monooxygenase HmoA